MNVPEDVKKLMEDIKMSEEALGAVAEIRQGVYGRMVDIVHRSVHNGTITVDIAFKHIEDAARTTLGSVPTVIRTAKSVILTALEYGVALLDNEGKPLGKSEVEKRIKEKKEALSDVDKRNQTVNSVQDSHVCVTVDDLIQTLRPSIAMALSLGLESSVATPIAEIIVQLEAIK